MVKPLFRALRTTQWLMVAAAGLWVLSWLLGDTAWRVMWLEPPRWINPAQPVEFIAPHEHLVYSLLDAWHGIISGLASGGWISAGSASQAIGDGYSLGGFAQFLSVICLAAVFWVVSRALVASDQGHDASANDKKANQNASGLSSPASQSPGTATATAFSMRAEPGLGALRASVEPDMRPSVAELEDLHQDLGLARLALTNLMLDPMAQGFSDELGQASRHLQSALTQTQKWRDAHTSATREG